MSLWGKVFVSSLIFMVLESSAFANSPIQFIGKWKGLGTYIYKNELTSCSTMQLEFQATETSFTFAGGRRVCENFTEDFPPVTMDFRDGKLFFGNFEVGFIKGEVLESWFTAPDPEGGYRHWRMSMRKTGDHLIYEESRTLVGETTPLISFAGLLIPSSESEASSFENMKSLQKRHKGLSAEMLNVEKPTDPNHPGSEIYAYDVKEIKTNLLGRSVEVYLPVAKDATPSKRFPVIVFGHGQAITSSGYNLTFRHLARRGVAVVFPMYDKGFFDQEWRRMAQDFNLLTQETLKVYGDQLDNSQVIYSGHSKGAYVALMAAGAPSLKTSSFALNSVVLFAPAGFESEYLKNMDPNLPLSIIWGENDSVIKFSLQKDIFDKSQAKYKQLIKVKSYTQPALSADHFFILNEPTFLGGRQGLSSFHYHGVWKWLLGAVWDVEKGESAKNEFLYGEESLKSGQSGVVHDVERSW